MKFILLLVLACFSWGQTVAQDVDEVKSQISKIKKSRRYIYAEATAPTEADARHYAENKLYQAINEWIGQKKNKAGKAASLVVSNKKELWGTLSMPRGTNMQRSFVYVKKSDITPLKDAVVIENTNTPVFSKEEQERYPAAAMALLDCRRTAELVRKLEELKQKDLIQYYKPYASLKDEYECYLILYEPFDSGKVKAVLSSGAERVNIRTGKPDTILNYAGSKIIGVKLCK